MTLRIEKVRDEGRLVIRLIGRVQAESVAAVKAEIEGAGPRPALDVQEVTLVDVEAVRFLVTCEDSGVALLHCPPYIRRWMTGERPSHA